MTAITASVLVFFNGSWATVEASVQNMHVRHGSNAVSFHSIKTSLDLANGSLDCVDTLTVNGGVKELRLVLRTRSVIKGMSDGTSPVSYTVKDNAAKRQREITVALPDAQTQEKKLTISFSAAYGSLEKAKEDIKRGVAYVEDGFIGPEGAFLPSSGLWYPQEEDSISNYELSVTAPAGFTSVSEGAWLSTSGDNGLATDVWKTEAPLDGVDIVTGKYHVGRDSYDGVDIYTFFLSPDDALSRLYIDKTKQYLKLYGGMIAPYPFKKFAVVEEILPTGYGMPSFTLLGSSVLRLPFIPDTSLGHEIAHSWWGNSAFVDPSGGNWSEALTTYTADYLYSKRAGGKEASAFRLGKLRGYKNFAVSSRLALKDFTDATSPESRAVGYNKGVMVFNMLEGLIGKDAFSQGVKTLYKTVAGRRSSWADIRTAFEKASGRDLSRFFDEWVDRPGGPSISLAGAGYVKGMAGYTVSFTLKQSAPAYTLRLPVSIAVEAGVVERYIDFSSVDATFSIDTPSRPLSIEIDPDYETFRLLSGDEMPATLGAFFGRKDGVIVLPAKGPQRERYSEVAAVVSRDFGMKVADDSGGWGPFNDAPVLILGYGDENALSRKVEGLLPEGVSLSKDALTVNGKSYDLKGSAAAVCVKGPGSGNRLIAIFFADPGLESVSEAGKKLRYFSEASYLILTDGKAEKGTFPAVNALKRPLAADAP